MSLVGKRRAVAAVLAAVAIWPAVHFGLASRLHFDAWELFGFAMYALPQARVRVAVDGELSGRPTPVHVRSDDERMRAFARRRTLLGELAPPEPLARQLLAEEPRLVAVTVRIRRLLLDRESAHWVAEERAYRFPRE